MRRNLSKQEFRKVDKQLETGTIIKMKSGYEYVILGFEERGLMNVFCCCIEKTKYLQQPKLEDINYMPLIMIKGKIMGTVDKEEFDAWLLKVKLLGYCKNLETKEQIQKRNRNKYVEYKYGLYVDAEQLVLMIYAHIIMAIVCVMSSVWFRPCIYLLLVVVISFVLMLIFTSIDVKSYDVIDLDKNKIRLVRRKYECIKFV